MANDSLAVRDRSQAIEPSNMGELVAFAEAAAKSRLFGLDSPEAALMIAMAGRDLGFSYAQSLRAFHVVKGKPTLSADGMVAACLASGECEFFRAVEVTDDRAVWETKRRGSQLRRYEFTMQDAKRAGIAGDMYAKHPKRMLSARSKSYLARDEYADVLLGLVTEDEAHEIADRSPAPRASAAQYVAEIVREPVPSALPALVAMARAGTCKAEMDAAFVAYQAAQPGMSEAECSAFVTAWTERRDALREIARARMEAASAASKAADEAAQ